MADATKYQGKAKGGRKPRAANVLTDTAIFAGAPVQAPEADDAENALAAAVAAPICATETAVEAIQPLPVEAVQPAPIIEASAEAVTDTADPISTTVDNTTTQTGADTMTDTIQNTVNNAQAAAQQSADQFRGAMNQANERGKAALERSARYAEEFADITRGNLEAVVNSSKTAAKYVETLAQGAADYSRRSFEEASAAMRSFAEVKSPADLFRLQSEFARTAFDSAIAETARVSETVVKMGGEVAEPITSRYAVAAERMKGMNA